MQSRFYVSHNGLDLGPFTVDQIKQKIQADELLPIDYMFVEEKDDWVLISEFIDLSETAAAPPEAPTAAAESESPVAASAPEEDTQTNTVIEIDEDLDDPYPDIDTSPKIIALQNRSQEDQPPALNDEDTPAGQDIDFSDYSDPDKQTGNHEATFQLGGETTDSHTDPHMQSGLDEGTDPHLNIDHELTYPSFNLDHLEQASTQETESISEGHDEEPAIAHAELQAQHEEPASTSASLSFDFQSDDDDLEPLIQGIDENSAQAEEPQPPIEAQVQHSSDKEEDDKQVQSLEADTFVDGQATLRLSLKKAKSITLSLADHFHTGLQMSNEARVLVKPAPGTQIHLAGPDHCVAGEPTEFHLTVQDDYGNHDESFSGQIDLELSGHATTSSETINIVHGKAAFKVSNNKAEEFSVQLKDNHSTGLRVPESHTMECQAGPAHQILLESPTETTAGEDVEVKLKVVDAYGNPAKDFKGKVALNVNGIDYETNKAS